MQVDKEEQEISVLGRLCLFEVLVLIMGVVSIIYGVVVADWNKALVGALVLAVAGILLQMSKRWCRGDSTKKGN